MNRSDATSRTVKNRLAAETSPYLQQHAENPVDWYPWGEEALDRARREDKPILLSIGYSACHWCHVMAHESFEDAAVAEIMNRHFVNVKVDREERPDLDQIYQAAHQMFNQRAGGWPLTAFLAPDQTPFFVGTYFPKAPRYNLPGFPRLLEQIAQVYREKKADIARQNQALREAFARMQAAEPGDGVPLAQRQIDEAARRLAASFDTRYGGFGGAPKFPHPVDLELMLRRHAATGDEEARRVAIFTLERMAEGGLYDQLGGGFCRYSVDERWLIPHFEKMLYDNGPLLGLYADAWAVTRQPLFARIAEETAAWTIREMQSPEGGYYSSLDADSEGHEGKFYVWTPDQVRALLAEDEYAVVAPFYGLEDPPNFEGEAWHLHVSRPLAHVALHLGRSEVECERLLTSARASLFGAREQRVRPGRDDKVLTSWNALMIRGMAHAGRVLDRPEWIASARKALDFARGTLWRDGRLLATYKDGRAHLNAYLDDHAFLLDALIEHLQAEYRNEDLAFAQTLADALLERFEDRAAGGFFFTSHDHEALLHRPKPGHDNATPSGNGVAAFALQRLGHLTGDPRYLDAADRVLRAFQQPVSRHPEGFASLLNALSEQLTPTRVVVLRGPADRLGEWARALGAKYQPDTMVLALPEALQGLPDALSKPAVTGEVNAYLCQGVSCFAPIKDLHTLFSVLHGGQIE
ncbi:MAG: thioredoxin domain-containing protein [Burkholderiales bacterium]